MAYIYRVCSGNTSIDISVSLSTVGSCSDCQTWYANYYDNERCYQTYRLTLDQASPTAFTVTVSINYQTELNGEPEASGYYLYDVYVPAGVLTYDFEVMCSESISGSASDNPAFRDQLAPV
jgi:hypothetical protein